jgi:hypothetical protein
MIVNDSIKKTQSLIFNGKKVHESDLENGIYLGNQSINLSKSNGKYIVQYYKSKQRYVNLNGTLYGPYEDAYSLFCPEKDEVGVMYKLGLKYYFKVNNEKYGPFIAAHDGILLNDSKRIFERFYSYSYNQNYTAAVAGKDYLEIAFENSKIALNGNVTVDPGCKINSLSFNSLNDYGFACETSNYKIDKFWVNGLQVPVQNFIYYINFFYIKNKDYYYSTRYNMVYSIYKNGNRIYDNITAILAYNRDNLFLFKDTKGDVYLNGKKIFSSQNAEYYEASIFSMNEYAFTYKIENDYYLFSSKGNFGPYDDVYNLKFDNNGKLSYTFLDNNIKYLHENGTNFPNKIDIDFYDSMWYSGKSLIHNGHNFESSYEYDYVVIDGESFGKSAAIQAWIDPLENSFKWTAIENNEYVLYAYPLK